MAFSKTVGGQPRLSRIFEGWRRPKPRRLPSHLRGSQCRCRCCPNSAKVHRMKAVQVLTVERLNLFTRTGKRSFLGVFDAPPPLVVVAVADHSMLPDEVVLKVKAKRYVGLPRIAARNPSSPSGAKLGEQKSTPDNRYPFSKRKVSRAPKPTGVAPCSTRARHTAGAVRLGTKIS